MFHNYRLAHLAVKNTRVIKLIDNFIIIAGGIIIVDIIMDIIGDIIMDFIMDIIVDTLIEEIIIVAKVGNTIADSDMVIILVIDMVKPLLILLNFCI